MLGVLGENNFTTGFLKPKKDIKQVERPFILFYVSRLDYLGKMCHRRCRSGSQQEEKKVGNKTSILTKMKLLGRTVGKSFSLQRMWKAGNTQHL